MHFQLQWIKVHLLTLLLDLIQPEAVAVVAHLLVMTVLSETSVQLKMGLLEQATTRTKFELIVLKRIQFFRFLW